jgi:hypothetical protein
MTISHGTILGVLSAVPSIELGIAAYACTLGLDLVEEGALDASLARSWGCRANVGARYAVFRPASGSDCWIRLVEQPDHSGFTPTRSFGWAAFEMSVEDVFGLAENLARSEFEIIGPPRAIANMEPAFIPMQVLGPGREMVYLNQVLKDMPNLDLPKAGCVVDMAFIVILAARDRTAALEWYRQAIGLDQSDSYTIPYSMINKAFDLPADHMTTITMLAKGRMPIIEVDDYPAGTVERVRHPGMLPPGNSLVTLAVASLDDCRVDWIAPPCSRAGSLYQGRRAGCTVGPSGELLELVEMA